ncbi:hypothetical protein EON65_36670 [archaeon]|nr:MAG: hypothetical protein EON65_36670 [archaeon]
MASTVPSAVPTVSPTFLSTIPDDVPSTLVLGMGAGTFTIIVLSVVLAVIWGFSIACELKKKIAFRSISTVLYGVVFIILVFSPRESRYEENDEDLTKVC